MSEQEEKVHKTIHLTQTVNNAMLKYKRLTGMSINSQIYASISAWLFIKKLLTLDEANGSKKETKKEVKTEPMPEGVKFCDGDSCEIDYSQK